MVNFLDDKVRSIEVLSSLSDEESFYLSQFKADIFYEAKMGAEAILEVLSRVDTEETVKNLKKELNKTSSKVKKKKIMYKIRISKWMEGGCIKAEWMVLRHVRLSPDLRLWSNLPRSFLTSD